MNNQENIWKIGKWAGIALTVFLAVISIKEIISIKYVGKGDFPSLSNISVTGKGEAISIPDIATFSFSVNENAKTVKEAQNKATEKTNTALKVIRSGGVADKDIKTISYSINPHYEYEQGICSQYGCTGGKSVQSGYDVSQTIEVKIRDLEKAGELFDSIGNAGIKTVNGLTFAIDDIDVVKEKARQIAIANAKEKAEKIAKSLGVKLVKITSYYDSSDEVYPMYAREGMSADTGIMKASIAPEIPKGEQKVTASVSIGYEIK